MVTLFETLSGPVFYFLAFVAALSIIVTVHEFGHCIVQALVPRASRRGLFAAASGPILASRVDRRGF